MLPPHAHRRILLLKENLENGRSAHCFRRASPRAGSGRTPLRQPGDSRATPLARLWKAASQADVTIATHNFLPAYVAWLLGQWHRKPVITWFHGPLLEVLDRAIRFHCTNCCGPGAGCTGGCLGWCSFPTSGRYPSWNSWVTTRQHTSACRSFPTRTLPGPAARPAPPPGCAAHGDVAMWAACHQKSAPELLIDTLTQLPQHYALQITGEGSFERRSAN